MANGKNTLSCVGLLACHYGRLEWTLLYLEEAPDIAYQVVLQKFDLGWCVKGLIVTCSNLMVTGKAPDEHYFLKSLWVALVPLVVVLFLCN